MLFGELRGLSCFFKKMGAVARAVWPSLLYLVGQSWSLAYRICDLFKLATHSCLMILFFLTVTSLWKYCNVIKKLFPFTERRKIFL